MSEQYWGKRPIQHTPGPWHWESDPIKEDPLNRVRYRVVTKGKTVTQCYYDSGDPSVEADARTISAAPEMLEACRLLVDATEVMDDGPDASDRAMAYGWLERAIELAREAVRKAVRESTERGEANP